MRKIRNIIKEKAGVSPIIAIILMVAITVVLAATIYVWVSGMGGGGGTKYALSLRQIDVDNSTGDNQYVEYRVDSVSGGPGWSDIKIKVGSVIVWDGSNVDPEKKGFSVTVDGTPIDSLSGNAKAISAGQTLKITDTNSSTSDDIDVGDTVSIIDIDSGQIIWSAKIHY